MADSQDEFRRLDELEKLEASGVVPNNNNNNIKAEKKPKKKKIKLVEEGDATLLDQEPEKKKKRRKKRDPTTSGDPNAAPSTSLPKPPKPKSAASLAVLQKNTTIAQIASQTGSGTSGTVPEPTLSESTPTVPEVATVSNKQAPDRELVVGWSSAHPRYWNFVPPSIEEGFAAESRKMTLIQNQLLEEANTLRKELVRLRTEYKELPSDVRKKHKRKKEDETDAPKTNKQNPDQESVGIGVAEEKRFSERLKDMESYVSSVERKLQSFFNRQEATATSLRILAENHTALQRKHREFARNMICHVNMHRSFDPNVPGAHLINNPFIYV